MKTFDLPYHRRNFLIYLCMLLEREIRYNQRAKPSVFRPEWSSYHLCPRPEWRDTIPRMEFEIVRFVAPRVGELV